MSEKKKESSFINVKAFTSALIVIAVLMVLTYVLTLVIPCEGIPFLKWLASPVLVLGAEGSATLIAVLVFLLVIGGIFNAMDKRGIMRYMLDRISARYGGSRYRLMSVIVLFFMAMGSLMGSFEECVPLVPIVTALAIRLGWDAVTGMGMSLLAVGCGFAAGVFNPFTVGIAQELAGLPMFSGWWFRAIGFVLIYLLLMYFLRARAKAVDTGVKQEGLTGFVPDKRMDRAILCFAVIMGIGLAIVMASALITVLQDYTMIIVAVMFLIAGTVACLTSGMKLSDFGKGMGSGMVSMLPAIVMILMASSIKYTLQESGALDVIIQKAMVAAQSFPRWAVILFIYLLVLVMNFFIPSGSAKAIMLIPIIVPLAAQFGISAQLCVVAYAFGDGFSNVFYPTNPALLISLGLVGVSYGEWFSWSKKFQLANLLLTSGLLLFGLAIGLA